MKKTGYYDINFTIVCKGVYNMRDIAEETEVSIEPQIIRKTIMLTETEKKMLDVLAASKGLTTSSYLRLLLHEAADKEPGLRELWTT